VVENLVAGLLMLIERPIRVGDWVVIGTSQPAQRPDAALSRAKARCARERLRDAGDRA
jgi:small-conductance mechanosensitive channel